MLSHITRVISAGLLLLLTLGCKASSAPTLMPGENVQGVRRWSAPVYFHGVAFSFEVKGPEEAELHFAGELENAIFVGDRRVIYRGGQFYIGQQRYSFSPRSRVLLYLPVTRGERWRVERHGVEIEWLGNGYSVPIEERRARRWTRWHCYKGTVELTSEGRVRYHGPRKVRVLRAPVRLRLDPLGNLVWAQRKK